MTRRTAITTLGLIVTLLTGCTVDSQRSATRVDPEDVPFDLLDEATTSTPSATVVGAVDVRDIYLVHDERLSVVTRPEVAVDAANLLSLLAAGPTEDEIETGIRTALVPDLARVMDSSGEIVVVDLAAEFSSLAPTEQRLALAQITYTLTQLPVVAAVRFLVAGQEVSVPRGDGSSIEREVTPDDYAELGPPERRTLEQRRSTTAVVRQSFGSSAVGLASPTWRRTSVGHSPTGSGLGAPRRVLNR